MYPRNGINALRQTLYSVTTLGCHFFPNPLRVLVIVLASCPWDVSQAWLLRFALHQPYFGETVGSD